MRQIKFRCWNGEQMVSPDYITRDGTAWWKENSIPTSSTTLLQFTGLLDKNSKEIYEGDIVKYSSEYKVRIENNTPVFSPSSRISEIIFYEGCFCEIYHSHNNSYFGDLPSKPKRIFFQIFKEYADSYEVIGNIYENPELLNNE